MIKRKNFITNVITAVLLLVLVSICFYAYTVSPKTELSVRDVELNTIQLDYSSILNEFENAELKTEGSLTTFVGYKTLDASLFDELDNVSDSNVEQEEGCQVKYNFSYDSETNIVTLSAVMENGEKLEIEEIYGSAFFDENGKLDAVMDLDGEYILLSEMQNLNLIQNCGWFSNLFKKIAKVVVAVAAVAVCVATAGAGVAAVIAVGAAVSCAESLATQLIETGTVNVGRLAVETAIGAIPGGQGAKTVAKETVKVASSTVGKKVVKEATSTATEKVAGKTAGKNVPKPSGEWKVVNESMSNDSRAYQKQITGKEGQAYVQNNVKFDGERDGVLLDAKCHYSQFVDKNKGTFYSWFNGADSLVDEARRQIVAAKGVPIEWHFAEEASLNAVKELFSRSGNNIKGIELKYTPIKK